MHPDYYWLKIENERTYDVEVRCFCQRQEEKLPTSQPKIVWPFIFVLYGLFFVHELKLGY